MITIEYRIDRSKLETFMALATPLGRLRRRDGAYAWGLTVDAGDSERVVEWFLVGSWAEHLRQHARVTASDRTLQERVRALHLGDTPPLVRHLVPIGAAMPPEARAHLSLAEANGEDRE